MTVRQNFDPNQRRSALENNAWWLRDHRVDGVELALAFEALRRAGAVYYCENCLFCHTDAAYFDVDHLVPDRDFRVWQKHQDARDPLNMAVLCKSVRAGDRGCNQSKGAKAHVPRDRGLAFSCPDLDMNCVPLRQRPFEHTPAR